MPPTKTPLLLAFLAGFAAYLLPYGALLTYPFTLFVTFIHEGGHALMTLVTGGSVQSMAIAPDGSGLTQAVPRNWLAAVLIANAGYLSAIAYGAGLLRLANRRTDCRGLLRFSALLLIGLVLFFTVFVNDWLAVLWAGGLNITLGMKLFTVLSGVVIALALWLLAQASPRTTAFLANFLAIECLFNGLGDIKTVLALSIYSSAHSDARNLAALTGIPAVAWALGWGLLSLWLIVASLRVVLAARR